MYGISVILSGLATLTLSSKEEKLLNQYYKVHLQKLLKSHQATPAPVVFFLAGRQLTPENVLPVWPTMQAESRRQHLGPSGQSHLLILLLLIKILVLERQLCLQYSLPHPSEWLLHQPSKHKVKVMAKSAGLQCSQADNLSSLKYLQTNFLGLTTCHPMFRLCCSSPREVKKASCQARLLSGRYRVEALSGHWTP